MKEKKLNFKSIFYLMTLLSVVILCNLSVVQADSNAPTECRISINNNALYTNNRYVTLELYATDADAMQVWISNDGETGTVVDFAYNKTFTITDQNYTIGVNLDSTNSTTSTNSDNVLRIENWPLSSINGTKKVYAVFRDAYGNKTSVSGLTTISVSYNLNGVSGTTPSTTTTVKNLAVYLPNVKSNVINKSFMGWSTSSDATISNYSPNSLGSFSSNTNLYAIYKTISVGDYVYYELDRTKSLSLTSGLGGAAQTLSNSSKFSSAKQVFKVIQVSSSSISISPMKTSQVYNISVHGYAAYNTIGTVVSSVSALYATNTYSSSTAVLSTSLMTSVASDPDFATLFSYNGFSGTTYTKDDGEQKGVYMPKIGDTSDRELVVNYGVGYTQSAYVFPVITLKSTVRFSGAGTSTEPYTMMIQ